MKKNRVEYIFLEQGKEVYKAVVDSDTNKLVKGSLPPRMKKSKLAKEDLSSFLNYRAQSLGNTMSLEAFQTGIIKNETV